MSPQLLSSNPVTFERVARYSLTLDFTIRDSQGRDLGSVSQTKPRGFARALASFRGFSALWNFVVSVRDTDGTAIFEIERPRLRTRATVRDAEGTTLVEFKQDNTFSKTRFTIRSEDGSPVGTLEFFGTREGQRPFHVLDAEGEVVATVTPEMEDDRDPPWLGRRFRLDFLVDPSAPMRAAGLCSLSFITALYTGYY